MAFNYKNRCLSLLGVTSIFALSLLPITKQVLHEQKNVSPLVRTSSPHVNKNASSRALSIRVLLDEKKDNQTWTIGGKQGLLFTNLEDNRKKTCTLPELTFSIKNGSLTLNGITVKEKKLKIDAKNQNNLIYNKQEYQGSFLLIMDEKKQCLIINQVDLEDYIYSVLRSESWPGWPLEVNKAFAIASRSYAMVKYLENKKSKKPFHLKNTNIHQTYNGFHTSAILKQAVEETSGLILTYNKAPITAMFDCCCGDIIPAHLNTIDFNKAPYLARKVPCTFCKSSKIYRWQLEFEIEEFKNILKSAGLGINQVKDIYVSKEDRAGAVEEIIVLDLNDIHSITGKQFYSMISKIKSFCYSILKKGKKIYIHGKGYGHHLGICQWGARNMINFGWNYRSILNFYYPDTILMKLAATLS